MRLRRRVHRPLSLDLDAVAVLFAAAPCTRPDDLTYTPLPEHQADVELGGITDLYPLESTAHRLHLHGSQTYLN
jgi:hypothetical protein